MHSDHSLALQESQRLSDLYAYGILDTGREEEFDLLTAAASEICAAPYAYVSLVDRERVWIKSSYGLHFDKAARCDSYCSLAVLQGGMVIPDLLDSPQTAHMLHTIDAPFFRMYAGAVLKSSRGSHLGTLCVLDTQPHALTQRQQYLLEGLAKQVMTLIELRLHQRKLEQAMQQLQLQAHTDPLTGLSNRRHFQQRLHEAMARLNRSGPQFSAVLLDLDHFKRINDTYGHEAGDAVLVAVARVLKDSTRAVDTVARIGGEEFCVLLDHTDRAQAMAWANATREKIAAEVLATHSGVVRVTASIGVASTRQTDHAIQAQLLADELLQLADRAMYSAKTNGRNRVEVCEAGVFARPQVQPIAVFDHSPVDAPGVGVQPEEVKDFPDLHTLRDKGDQVYLSTALGA
jgi:diguanylate cyclase (GGDEF)-like protein